MSGTRTGAVDRRRYMKLFMVFYWGKAGEPGPDGGIFVVRAAKREDCVQLLLREKVTLTPGQDTTDVLQRIRDHVLQAKTFKLQRKFQHAKIVEELETRYDDFL